MSIELESNRISPSAHLRGRPWFAFRTSDDAQAGIDITDAGITLAVEVDQGDGDGELELASGQCFWLSQQSLPTGAVVGAEVVQPGTVAEAIQAMLVSAPVTVDRCAMAIPAGAAIARLVTLPKGLSEVSAEAHLSRSTAELIAQPRTEIALDFRPLPALSSAASEASMADQNWLLLAARLDWVQQRQALAQRLDLRLTRVDWGACAQWRAMLVTQALEAQAPPQAVMVHWDERGGTLMATHHGWPVHVEHRPALAVDALVDWLDARTRAQPLLSAGLATGPLWVMGLERLPAVQKAFVRRYGADVQSLTMPCGLSALAACGLAMEIGP